jgi:hypothetical protein
MLGPALVFGRKLETEQLIKAVILLFTLVGQIKIIHNSSTQNDHY